MDQTRRPALRSQRRSTARWSPRYMLCLRRPEPRGQWGRGCCRFRGLGRRTVRTGAERTAQSRRRGPLPDSMSLPHSPGRSPARTTCLPPTGPVQPCKLGCQALAQLRSNAMSVCGLPLKQNYKANRMPPLGTKTLRTGRLLHPQATKSRTSTLAFRVHRRISPRRIRHSHSHSHSRTYKRTWRSTCEHERIVCCSSPVMRGSSCSG